MSGGDFARDSNPSERLTRGVVVALLALTAFSGCALGWTAGFGVGIVVGGAP